MCDWTCVCRVGGCVTGHVCVGLGEGGGDWTCVCRVGGCVTGHVCVGLGDV